MGAKENLELIEELQRAVRDLDFERYGQLLADDATLRTGGVPAGLGGVLTGRQAIVDQFRLTGGAGSVDIKQIFGDDKQVCVVGKVTAERFVGSGADDDDRPQRRRTCSCRSGAGVRRRSALPDRLPTSLIRATSVGNAVGLRGFVRCAVTLR